MYCTDLLLIQIDAAQFSLEHPTQYYKESRELRGHKGGGVKQETTPTKGGGVKQETTPTKRPIKQEHANKEEDFCNMSIQDIQSFEEDMEL